MGKDVLHKVGNGGHCGCETVSREVLPQVEIPEKWTQEPPCFAITIWCAIKIAHQICRNMTKIPEYLASIIKNLDMSFVAMDSSIKLGMSEIGNIRIYTSIYLTREIFYEILSTILNEVILSTKGPRQHWDP